MPQLHSCDFACSQLGSPRASLEGSWGLLGPFLGHLWGIWGPFEDVVAGALGGFLGSAKAFFVAIIGCPRCSLQALRELDSFWRELQDLPILKAIRATSQQVRRYRKKNYSRQRRR